MSNEDGQLVADSGADVMKRIAAPMIGGITSALIMVLVVFSAIFAIWKQYELRHSR